MSPIVSCGIDIVEIEKIRELYLRYGERFLRRILSPAERELLSERRNPVSFLAGRFAAKEAVLKVLGVGVFQGVPLSAIEVPSQPSGEPFCVLRGAAAARARERGIGSVLVSISHADSYAVAQALGLGPEGAGGGRPEARGPQDPPMG